MDARREEEEGHTPALTTSDPIDLCPWVVRTSVLELTSRGWGDSSTKSNPLFAP